MIIPRLRPDTLVSVEYSDKTPFGSPITPKLRESMNTLFSDFERIIEDYGPIYLVKHSDELLSKLRGQTNYTALLDEDPKRLRRELLYPEKGLIKPVALNIHCKNNNEGLRIQFESNLITVIHNLMNALYSSEYVEETDEQIAELYSEIIREAYKRKMLMPRDSNDFIDEEKNRQEWKKCQATFVGHASVVVRSQTTQIIVDPWFFPRSKNNPKGYHPISRSEIGKIDAILITHSHPDHFDPGSLIQFSTKTKVIVPRVEKESILSIDMAFRLKELGFEDVQIMDWWEEKQVGDIRIIALPFYGEQPTSNDQLCPEIRLAGNTYLVKTPDFSCAFIADAGRDRDGDIKEVALEAYRKWGKIDVLFSGYRGWYLYPIQYIKSSVPWYLLFVPSDLYSVRQSIMNDKSQAVDTAETWHASFIVPYADGGAPWYSEIGLGPDFATLNKEKKEWAFFDPLPETCIDEVKLRSAPTPDIVVGSPVSALILRPGQSIIMKENRANIVESESHNTKWFSTLAGELK
jgi:L-ascorbate metabolism protein UlaG (beta-lactamase superfamily)